MLVIGLTGGIGSGKSTVTKLFATLDVPVIDTDVVAREVVIPGSKALNEIQLCFGERYIQSDGHLDRAAMRQLVFADDDARAKLESILHHRIHRSVWNWIEQQQADYCIVVVPLLFEKGWDEYFDRILVVD
ncbi:MAG: dephospho-CoA kinase, partial [Gammaproteobacteria bacterium]|nr:dephospho-CoA kinase [Gammaproteobacteria bacterium]